MSFGGSFAHPFVGGAGDMGGFAASPSTRKKPGKKSSSVSSSQVPGGVKKSASSSSSSAASTKGSSSSSNGSSNNNNDKKKKNKKSLKSGERKDDVSERHEKGEDEENEFDVDDDDDDEDRPGRKSSSSSASSFRSAKPSSSSSSSSKKLAAMASASYLDGRQTSAFRGVSCCGKDRKYQARIRDGSKVHYLGRFNSEFVAAIKYDEAAREFKGDSAVLNFFVLDPETAERMREVYDTTGTVSPEFHHLMCPGTLERIAQVNKKKAATSSMVPLPSRASPALPSPLNIIIGEGPKLSNSVSDGVRGSCSSSSS